MHKTTTALLAAGVFLAVLLVVTGATWLGNGRHFGPPTQPRVEQAQAYSPAYSPAYSQAYSPAYEPAYTVQAVCMTDAECAEWDAAGYTMPVDQAGDLEPSCTTSTELYDTENPDMGDHGIVCRPLMEV